MNEFVAAREFEIDTGTRRLSVRIDKDIKHAAERAAEAAHQSLAYYVATALSDKLAKGDQA